MSVPDSAQLKQDLGFGYSCRDLLWRFPSERCRDQYCSHKRVSPNDTFGAATRRYRFAGAFFVDQVSLKLSS